MIGFGCKCLLFEIFGGWNIGNWGYRVVVVGGIGNGLIVFGDVIKLYDEFKFGFCVVLGIGVLVSSCCGGGIVLYILFEEIL